MRGARGLALRALAAAAAWEPPAQVAAPCSASCERPGVRGCRRGCAEVAARTSETLVLGPFLGREGPPGGASGAVEFGRHRRDNFSRNPRGSPRLSSRGPRQTDPPSCAPRVRAVRRETLTGGPQLKALPPLRRNSLWQDKLRTKPLSLQADVQLRDRHC